MYKYKKTIIINNRRRRIFSKEKSNTEYILYKKEYITLNAYNKKTGGGTMIKYITNPANTLKRIFSDSYSISEFDINYFDIINYMTSNNKLQHGINTYNFDLSHIISSYLKDISKINTGNNKIWIITEINGNNLKVNGFNDKNEYDNHIDDLNSKDNLINYGELDTNIEYVKSTFPKIITNEIEPTPVKLKKLLKFNTENYITEKGYEVYNELYGEGIYIYIYTTNYEILNRTNNTNKILKEGEEYEFYNCKFRCDKIYATEHGITGNGHGESQKNFKYDILFKYISKLNTECEIIKFGENNNKSFINYDNKLYYNCLVSHDGRKVYDKLNINGCYIYLVEIYIPDKFKVNNIYIKYNTNFICEQIINEGINNYYIFKYLGDFTTKDNIIKYANIYEDIKLKEYDNKSLLYYKYINDKGRKIYDNLITENNYVVYHTEIVHYKDTTYASGNIYKLYNSSFECVIIFKDYPSIYKNTIVFKYLGNTPTAPDIAVGGQRKLKNLKSKKKYLK